MKDAPRCWYPLPTQWRQATAATQDSVLLETACFDAQNHRSFLFIHPVRVVSAASLDQLPQLFQDLDAAIAEGLYVAGYLDYECGYHFQSLENLRPGPAMQPLAWFGAYRSPLIFDHETGSIEGDITAVSVSEISSQANVAIHDLSLGLSKNTYCEKIEKIQEYIAAGDTYQVNFTDSVSAGTSTDIVSIFESCLGYQPVSYGAFLHTEKQQILSFSPELFFRIEGNKITTRPMKGTMPRGLDITEDRRAAAYLKQDEKNRAEHVMIVDLLRNDLGRICATGSVLVEDIFSVEKYRTLFQMTSTVSGTLLPELSYYEIFQSLFPSGSVTGAPKIRTMQIIRELEQCSRGVYTGAIGYIAPDGSSAFNVAIRTLGFQNGNVHMGVGSGIVADSKAEDEYNECLLKANFLTHTKPEFQLIETMLWDKEFTYLLLHLDRLECSTNYFDFVFDRDAVQKTLAEEAGKFRDGEQYRVRLLLDSQGRIELAITLYQPENKNLRVRLAAERTFSGDIFLRHKTTHRTIYDRLYREARNDGFDEVLFLNERDEVTEGAISNLFILREGKMFTPPLSAGVLPGILRRNLLENDPQAGEKVLTVEDLKTAEAVFLANSVRGLQKVESWQDEETSSS